MKYTISTGRSRKETHWKVKEVEWSRLVEKLRNTHRTSETQTEYFKASKDIKSDIKDVGGFVGGAVSGGRRVKGSVKMRSLVTLDIDYAQQGVWDDITMNFDCAMCLYSTHSHTKESPRFRWVIPLDREVTAEEYEAIARKVAEGVGIDQFDDSSYQSERLMYWASTSSDGEFVFEEQKGEPLSADDVLAEYRDWRDISQWATSSRVGAVMHKMMRKKGEPTEAKGIVGVFCRAYTITEAIDTYLSDVYQPVANDDSRYTFLNGTSAAGLVVYDDKFAFSHHATDPASEQMCNAFDLVRVHLFGDMDEGVKDGTPINKYPSFIKMSERAAKDPKVMKEQRASIEQRLHEDFGDLYDKTDDSEDTDDSWMDLLERDKHGTVQSNSFNVVTILENAKGFKGNLRRNDFTHFDEATSALPWRKVTPPLSKRWDNDDDARLRVYLDRYFKIKGKDIILNSFTEVVTSHRYHPIRDYLNTLEWDGTPRAETLLIDYLGAEDTELNRAVTRKFLTAAVARVFRPGCKFDYVTVIKGKEGIGKSTLLKALAGEGWFNDSIIDLNGKDAMEMLQGAWIIELGELQAIKHSEIEQTKAFISRQEDIYRPAYGRTKENNPRQCVFFATTNESAFLKGSDGNRRFWVVDCVRTPVKDVFDFTKDAELRNQIWAEAVTIFKGGETLYLNKTMEDMMRGKQEDYNELALDIRVGIIEEYLNKRLPPEWLQMDVDSRQVYLADEDAMESRGVYLRERVCAAEVLCECFKKRIDDRTKYEVKEINSILQRLHGWERSKTPIRFALYGLQRGFVRINPDKK